MTSSWGIQTYSYDNIYQVTHVDYPEDFPFPDKTFNYDPVGNRDSTVNGGTVDYQNNELNEYTLVDSVAYTSDPRGNLTDDGTQTYYYDYENRLTKVVRNSDGETLGEYKYDPFGRRAKKLLNGGTSVINYLYDGAQVIEGRRKNQGQTSTIDRKRGS
jgi:YD repeat-containing protein